MSLRTYTLTVVNVPPGETGYCVVDFLIDGVPFARRSFKDRSEFYAESAGDNWVTGVLKTEHFTMEEFLLAGAKHGR